MVKADTRSFRTAVAHTPPVSPAKAGAQVFFGGDAGRIRERRILQQVHPRQPREAFVERHRLLAPFASADLVDQAVREVSVGVTQGALDGVGVFDDEGLRVQ